MGKIRHRPYTAEESNWKFKPSNRRGSLKGAKLGADGITEKFEKKRSHTTPYEQAQIRQTPDGLLELFFRKSGEAFEEKPSGSFWQIDDIRTFLNDFSEPSQAPFRKLVHRAIGIFQSKNRTGPSMNDPVAGAFEHPSLHDHIPVDL